MLSSFISDPVKIIKGGQNERLEPDSFDSG